MNTRFLLLGLIACLCWCFSPNVNAQTVLPLNGNATGVISTPGDTALYSLTTNADGQINLTLTVSNNQATFVGLYDSDHVTVLVTPNYTYTGPLTISADGLSQGKYFVKIYPYYGTGTPQFTIANTLTVAMPANDHEADNSPAQADVLTLNDSTTGHVGYYYNHYRDTADWYKVTTNADGLLRLRLKVANNQPIFCALYDNDGTTLVNSAQYTYTTEDINTDGLAAGTYYVKIYGYYSTTFGEYTLSDSLFTPAQANDKEPNNSVAEADVLTLNDSTTGHVGYYYKLYRDTADWYKVTTNADGLLRLRLNVANNTPVFCTLYDNDGTTVLSSAYTYTTEDINTDGLASGTYYVKVYCYYNSQFAPYTLLDSLFAPAQADDKEPNNSVVQADVLNLNNSTTGHVGYYYNHYRDTADWYKVTTNADGLLRLRLNVADNIPVFCTLYDHNGTTILNSQYTYINEDVNTDGLTAGTYYVKVYCYYNSQFAPYTLSDSLFTYNPHDPEPNDSAFEASTIPANRTVTGHVGFYYNLARDTLDYWKVNYTGSGNLNFTFNIIPQLGNSSISPIYFDVYKDTTKSPIFTAYYQTASTNISLTGLSQGYYYIKIIPYYSSQFNAYSITGSFTQVNIAAINLLKATTQNSCGNDSLIYKLSSSHSPYTVRLYKNGLAYDSLVTTSDSARFIGLNGGNYYATIFGDGATDNAFGKTTSLAVLPPTPTGLNVTNIKAGSATLNWIMLPCTNYDTVQYREKSSATWIQLTTPDNSGMYDLAGLVSNTTYVFRVVSVDSGNNQKVSGTYSIIDTFTTSGALPVTIVNFGATVHNNLVTLNWSTATEINNKGFEIFRSVDGTNFTSIGFVAGAGNSNVLQQYQYTDNPEMNGKIFYRFRQIDFDGNFVWSPIVYVTINANQLITFMPNPAKNFITISSSVIVKQIRLLSINGQLIKAWNYVSPNAQLDLGTITSGSYLIQFINDRSTQTQKLVKE